MNAGKAQYVFGYGSLTARAGLVPTRELKDHGFVADLVGLRRTWGVAMDNRRDLPGYKYYTVHHGGRPQVLLAYLDLDGGPDDTRPRRSTPVLPVGDDRLPDSELAPPRAQLRRTDVSERVAGGGARSGPTFGSAPARERLAAGRRGRHRGHRTPATMRTVEQASPRWAHRARRPAGRRLTRRAGGAPSSRATSCPQTRADRGGQQHERPRSLDMRDGRQPEESSLSTAMVRSSAYASARSCCCST